MIEFNSPTEEEMKKYLTRGNLFRKCVRVSLDVVASLSSLHSSIISPSELEESSKKAGVTQMKFVEILSDQITRSILD